MKIGQDFLDMLQDEVVEDREFEIRTTIRELVVYLLFVATLCVCKYFFFSQSILGYITVSVAHSVLLSVFNTYQIRELVVYLLFVATLCVRKYSFSRSILDYTTVSIAHSVLLSVIILCRFELCSYISYLFKSIIDYMIFSVAHSVLFSVFNTLFMFASWLSIFFSWHLSVFVSIFFSQSILDYKTAYTTDTPFFMGNNENDTSANRTIF